MTEPSAVLGLSIGTKTDVSCRGDATGAVVLNASGGTNPYTYSKDGTNFVASNSLSGLIESAYTFTVKDAAGCSQSLSTSISYISNLSASIGTVQHLLCYQGGTGSIKVNTTNAVGVVQYKIGTNPFQNSDTFNNLAAGVHQITVKDDGCIRVLVSPTITEPNNLVLSVANQTNILCRGNTTGAFKLSTSGGTGTIQFSKDDLSYQSLGSFTGLAAGVYTIYAKDANACKKTIVVTLTEPAAVLGLSVGTKKDVFCKGDATGAVTLIASGGTSPYTYSKDGTNFVTTNSFTGLTDGAYVCTVKDAAGCSYSLISTIAYASNLSASIGTVQNLICNQDGAGSIKVNAINAVGVVQYKIGTNPFQSSDTFNNLAAGVYQIAVADNFCYKVLASQTITEPSSQNLTILSKTDVKCNGEANGSLLVSATGGTGVQRYSIDNINFGLSNVFANISPGNYTITVKDANNCIKSQSFSIGQPSALTLSVANQINPICQGDLSGMVSLNVSGGIAPYRYSLTSGSSQNSATFNNLRDGVYSILVTDANGCTKTITINMPSTNRFGAAIKSLTNPTCFGFNNGSIAIAKSNNLSPVQFSIDGGNVFQTDSIFRQLASKNYIVVVKDANCTLTLPQVTLTNPQEISFGFTSKTDIDCFGNANGSIALSASGGSNSFSFSKDQTNFQANPLFQNLEANGYNFLVKDNNGCQKAFFTTINQPSKALSLEIIKKEISCQGNSDGSLTAQVSGGTSPYQYLMQTRENYQNSPVFDNLSGGTYQFLVKDAKGCIVNKGATLEMPTNPLIISVLEKKDLACNQNNTGGITLQTTGGVPPLSYAINNSAYQSSSVFQNLSAGTYTLQAKDSRGCSAASISQTLTEKTGLVLSLISKTEVDCEQRQTGKCKVLASGGQGIIRYDLIGKNFRNETITPTTSNTGIFENLFAGTYQIYATDESGCKQILNVRINALNPTIVFSVAITNPISCLDFGGVIEIENPRGGKKPYTFGLNDQPFGSSMIFNQLKSGSYIVSVADDFCVYSKDVVLGAGTAIKAQVLIEPQACNSPDAKVTLKNTLGGNGGYLYSKDGITFQNIPIFENINPGIRTFYIKDTPQSCIITNTVNIKDQNALNLKLLSKTDIACLGESTGTLRFSVDTNDAIFYQLDNGPWGNSSVFENLKAGDYVIKAKNSIGCTESLSISLSQPSSKLTAQLSAKDLSCFEDKSGSINIKASGGSSPYQYALNTGMLQNNTLFETLNAGTYQVKIIDDKGCIYSQAITLAQPPQLITTVVQTKPSTCFERKDAEIILETTGGTLPYAYQVGQQQFLTPQLKGLSSGLNYIETKDQLGCAVNLSVNIAQPLAINLGLSASQKESCGLQNGAISVLAIGGSGTFFYSIDGNNFATSSTFQNLSAGSYTIYAKDTKSCLATINVNLLSSTNLKPTTQLIKDPSCNQSKDGKIILKVETGIGPFTFSLLGNSFQNSPVFDGLLAGTYAFSTKDSLGCIAKTSVTLKNPTPISVSFQAKNVICYQEKTGSINVDAQGGTGVLLFSLNDTGFQSFNKFDSLKKGIFELTVKDENNCKATSKIEIKEPENQLILTIQDKKEINCFDESTGFIKMNAQGGWGTYLYDFGNGFQSLASVNNIKQGPKTIRVKDTEGCIAKTTTTFSSPSQLLVDIKEQQKPLCYDQSTGKISLNATGGTGTFQYALSGQTAQNSGIFQQLKAGQYSFEIKDSNGCIAKSEVSLENPLALNLVLEPSMIKCFGQQNGSIKALATGGTGSLQYEKEGILQTGTLFNNLSAGSYQIKVQDSKGCVASKSIEIIEPQTALKLKVISKQDLLCAKDKSGAIQLAGQGGTGTLSFDIGNGPSSQVLFKNLNEGLYNVTLNDANGCEAKETVVLNSPPMLELMLDNKKNPTCGTEANGMAMLIAKGGTQAYQYQINGLAFQSSPQFNNLSAGAYEFTVQDQNACKASYSTVLEQNKNTIQIQNKLLKEVSCFGSNDALLEINATGGSGVYRYALTQNTYQVSNQFDNLAAGNFTIWVKDDQGCEKNQAITLSQPTAINLTLSDKKIETCAGRSDGLLAFTTIGGQAPFKFNLEGISPTKISLQSDASIFTNLFAATYQITVQDSKGCTAKLLSTLDKAPTLDLAISKLSPVSCFDGLDGQVQLTSQNNSTLFSKDGILFQTERDFKQLKAGFYTFVAKLDGCITQLPVEVKQAPALNLYIGQSTQSTCFGDATASVTLVATGGTPTYSFSKNDKNFEPSARFDNLLAGNYQLWVKDANGCVNSVLATIDQPNELTINVLNQKNINCAGQKTGVIEIETIAKNQNVSLSVNNNIFTGSVLKNLTAGDYLFEIKNEKGCKASQKVVLTEPLPISLTKTLVNPICKDGKTGKIAVNVKGGTSPYQYQWAGQSQSVDSLFNIGAGKYTLLMTDAKGCVFEETFLLTEPSTKLTLALGDSAKVCADQALSLDAGNVGSKYQWQYLGQNFSTNQKVSISKPGLYQLVVSSNTGCTVSANFKLSISNTALKPDFLMPNEAFVGDTVVILDYSKPIPNSINWTFSNQNNRIIIDKLYEQRVKFFEAGTVIVKMEAILGGCKAIKERELLVKEIVRNSNGQIVIPKIIPNNKSIIKAGLMPNPNDGVFTLQLDLYGIEPASISLINSNSSDIIETRTLQGSDTYTERFDKRNLPTGIYYLRIITSKETKTLKVVIIN